MQEEDYIPVEQVAAMLNVTPRHAARYKDRVRTMKAGNRILYHREDILEQARIKGREEQARQIARDYTGHKPPKSEGLRISELFDYLRERDAQNERLQQQLREAAHRIGELEAQLKHAEERKR